MIGTFIPLNGRRNSPGWIVQENGCQVWTGETNSKGYGRAGIGGPRRCRRQAHILRYEAEIGPVPEGLQLDHLCRNRLCGNPAHLQPVTCRENLLRGLTVASANAQKSHCHMGHALSDDNLRIERHGRGRTGFRRVCLTCRRQRQRDRYQLLRGEPMSETEPASAVLARLADPTKRSDLTQDARQALLAGLRLDKYTPHPGCPCERCHRVFRTIP